MRQLASPRNAAVLYVHPRSQMMMDEIIPLSLPAMIGRIEEPVRGYFHNEVDARAFRHARVLLIDAHWYLSLPGALELAARARRANPNLKIIVGGLTASTFARSIVRESCVDYVVRGDGEGPLPQLVSALLDGQSGERVPNVCHAEFSTPWSFATDRALFDQLEYERWDFFPTFKQRIYGYHARRGRRVLPTHPFSMAFKGCPLACEHCVGSPRMQQTFFRRPPVVRSAEIEREHLERLSADPNLKSVNIFWDVVGIMPFEYAQTVYGGNYDLRVYYELAASPTDDALDLVLRAFRGGTIAFSVDHYHTTSQQLRDPETLIRQIRRVESTGRFDTQLEYSQTYCRESPAYDAFVRRIVQSTNTIRSDASFWWDDVPIPQHGHDGSDQDYQRYAANRARRFRMQNVIYKTGIAVHRVAPGLTDWLARHLYAHGAFTSGGS